MLIQAARRCLYFRGASTSRRTSRGAEMAAATVEVERKFRLTDAALARIRAQCRATGPPTVIHDVYFDVADEYSLTLHDHWLRRRNDAWELKFPSNHDGGGTAAASTGPDHGSRGSYSVDSNVEVTDAVEIVRHLAAYSQELAVSGLDDPRLCPFAELRTTRETFTVPDVDADAEIGVDSAEFLEGDHKSVVDTFGLVEIEIMCTPGGAEEANARRRIESIAEHLFGKEEAKEMQADQKLQGGKLMFYLEKYNPKMYEALVQKYVEKMAKRKHEGGTHL